MSIVTLTFDLWPSKSIGFILSTWLSVCQDWSRSTQRFSCYRVHKLISIYVHCDLDLWPLTSKINRVHPVIMVNMSAKLDKETCNGSFSIVFTTSMPGRTDAHTHTHTLTEPQQRYYIPTATRCAGIISVWGLCTKDIADLSYLWGGGVLDVQRAGLVRVR